MLGTEIESEIRKLLKTSQSGSVSIPEDALNRFTDRCRNAVVKRFTKEQDNVFRLRMSNIGRDIRTLWLDKTYGRPEFDEAVSLKMLYGDLIEALAFMLIESIPNVNITGMNKKVSIDVNGTKINGEYDISIDNRIIDVKSASPYSYDNKFVDYETLKNSDDFGYVNQIFGYAIGTGGEELPQGWLVFNKVDGNFKFVEVPDASVVNDVKQIKKDIANKVRIINNNLVDEVPACNGVVAESWYKKPTGRMMLGNNCRFCSHKDKCHPELYAVQDKVSKAKGAGIKYYTKLLDTDDEMVSNRILEGLFN